MRIPLARTCRLVAVSALTFGAWLAVSAAPALAAYQYPFIRQLSPFQFAFGSAVNDASGETLVADSNVDKIQVFDGSGNHVATWDGSAANNPPGTPSGNFGNGDIGVAANNTTGEVYVAESGDDVVDILNSSGGYVSQITSTPSGHLGTVIGVAVDQASGNVYVADNSSGVVDVFSSSGSFVSQISPAGSPVSFHFIASLAVDSATGDLFLADSGTSQVYEFTTAGSYLTTLTGAGTPQGSFGCGLEGVGVRDSDSHVFVTNDAQGGGCGAANVVDELDGSGNYVSQITSTPSGPLPNSIGVSVDQATGDEIVAMSSAVDVFGPRELFPDVTTGRASSLTQTSATLNGTVNPEGTAITDCHFDYGTSTSYGQTAPCASTPSGSSPVAVSANISGLTPGTTYHFRLVAANASGPTVGVDQLFGPPVVKLTGADAITPTGATLHATLNPQNVDTTYHFEYGTTTSYGSSVPVPDADIGAGSSDVAVTQALTGLSPNTTYHFRVVASNGITDGPDRTFTTLPPALIDVQPPTGMSTTTGLSNGAATLHVYLNPEGNATTIHFEYGTDTSYGSSTPTAGLPAATSPQLVSAPISGLAPGTTYHYRTVASNALGTATGPDSVFTTPPANCPNQQFRTGLSASLPDCRAYEQISPADKGGYPVRDQVQIAAGGDRAFFVSAGTFAGDNNEGLGNYVAVRGATGWSTAGLDPPVSLGQDSVVQPSVDLTAAASPVLFASIYGDVQAATSGALVRRRADGTWFQASPTLQRTDGQPLLSLTLAAGSADLSHLFFSYGNSGVGGSLLPGAPPGSLYEVAGADGSSPVLRLVSVDPAGHPITACQSGPALADRASEDGSTVFFQITATGCLNALYARLGGTTTVAISDPSPNQECTTSECVAAPLAPAGFGGASSDGSKAFFLSTQQLTDAASEDSNGSDDASGSHSTDCTSTQGPNGCNLYMYDFNRPAGHNLVAVSAGDMSGVGPQVRGVVRVSADGSTVYFVAGGVLTSQPNALGRTAQAGADNLYVYDTATGSVRFITELCSGQGQSGTLSGVASCPGSGSDIEALIHGTASSVTPDGRFLAVTSSGQLTPDDTDSGQSVFEYDAQTGGLWRVSVGHDGEDQNGNDGQDAFLQGPSERSFGPLPTQITDDGQTVVFTTPAPLQTGDSNGTYDAYEWHQGEVTLVSGGHSPGGADHPAITPSGSDIAFVTDEGLLPQDTDGLADVYDARIGGGFAPPPVTAVCQGDGCLGSPSGAPPLPLAASVSFSGPGNPSAGSAGSAGKARVLTRTVHGARFMIALTVPGAGRISITGAGIRGVSVRVRGAGSYRIRVTLTAKERRTLRHKRKLKLTLRVTYAPNGAAPSAALVHVTDKA